MIPECLKKAWEALAAFVRAIFDAIVSILFWPLRALGLDIGGRAASAGEIAADAIEAAAPEPEPAPSYELGELIRAHASMRLDRLAGIVNDAVLGPLPDALAAWMARMDRLQLANASRTPARYLEQHVATQPGRRGLFDNSIGPVHPPAALAAAQPITPPQQADGRTDRSGGGGQKAKPVNELLSELGIHFDMPAPSGPRR